MDILIKYLIIAVTISTVPISLFLLKKYRLKELDKPIIDVLDDVKTYLSPSKLKLSIAANEYGFSSTEYHNALIDCYATLHLMKTIEQVREICKWYI